MVVRVSISVAIARLLQDRLSAGDAGKSDRDRMTDGAMIGPTIHPRGMARDRLLRFGKRRLGNVVHGGTWILGFIRPTLVAKLRCADGLVTPGNAPLLSKKDRWRCHFGSAHRPAKNTSRLKIQPANNFVALSTSSAMSTGCRASSPTLDMLHHVRFVPRGSASGSRSVVRVTMGSPVMPCRRERGRYRRSRPSSPRRARRDRSPG